MQSNKDLEVEQLIVFLKVLLGLFEVSLDLYAQFENVTWVVYLLYVAENAPIEDFMQDFSERLLLLEYCEVSQSSMEQSAS